MTSKPKIFLKKVISDNDEFSENQGHVMGELLDVYFRLAGQKRFLSYTKTPLD